MLVFAFIFFLLSECEGFNKNKLITQYWIMIDQWNSVNSSLVVADNIKYHIPKYKKNDITIRSQIVMAVERFLKQYYNSTSMSIYFVIFK